MKTLNKTIFAAIALAATVGSSAAYAAPTPYANVGTINPDTYAFTAAATGHVIAYFVNSTAGYSEDLGLNINGLDSGVWGLNDHSSFYGQTLDFGVVNAGASLVFKTYVHNTGTTYYSKASLNPDGGLNHIYSNSYAGDSLIPAGTYVAFEDLWGGGDKNYHDENFVFTNVATSTNGGEMTATPIPAAIWMFGTGIAGLLGASKRKKTTMSA